MPKLRPSQWLAGVLVCVVLAIPKNPAVAQIVQAELPEWTFVQPSDVPIASHSALLLAGEPQLTAPTGLIVDLPSGSVLWSQGADLTRPPASTTKLMTALVARQVFTLDEVLTIDDSIKSEGTVVGLKPGEAYTVRDLLAALLVSSGNDAAEQLATHHPEGFEGFIRHMNRQATLMGLSNTHFNNPSGLDEPGHYSSAQDLSLIAQAVWQDVFLQELVGHQEYVISEHTTGKEVTLKTTNALLGVVPGVVGLKTGTTPAAGEVLVTVWHQQNREILTVVMGSTDRVADTKTLLEWFPRVYQWWSASQVDTLE
jgi:D-alanyl-D-alanine carboxypeptidase (penicillin-binding protein 5/6)